LSRAQQAYQSAIQHLSQQEAHVSAGRDAERQRLAEEGKKVVQQRAPNFDVSAVIDYVVADGMDREAAERDWPLNPQMAVYAHKAMLYDRMQQSAKAGVKRTKAHATPIKPAAKKGGRARPDPDRMPINQWMKERNKRRG